MIRNSDVPYAGVVVTSNMYVFCVCACSTSVLMA
jgi:hypothetical protein